MNCNGALMDVWELCKNLTVSGEEMNMDINNSKLKALAKFLFSQMTDHEYHEICKSLTFRSIKT